MLIYLVLQKADEETNRKWKESLDFKTLPTWDDCTNILERHCQYLDSIDSAHAVGPDQHHSAKATKARNQHKGHSFACSNQSCSVCSSNGHKVQNCDRFKALNVSQRFDTVKRLGLCINCLSKGHQLSNCPSTHRCRVCSRQHHSLLHRGTLPDSSNSTSPSAVHTHLNNSSVDHIILATAMVLVRDAVGNYRVGRALLDSCSQVNFITDELSQKLMLQRSKNNIEIQGIGKSSTNVKYQTSTNIRSQATGFELPLTFCITSHIAYQPEPEIDTSSWHIPTNIVLADDQFNKSKKIDLLLGTESFFSLLSVGQIKLGNNLPILQKTLLGWVVPGRYRASCPAFNTKCLLACDESIDSKMERLWQIEELATKADVWTHEQFSCERLYNETVTRSPSGRIIVKLPFKDDPACLGDSFTTALRRFNALERRLSHSPSLRANYVAFMEEYETLGHMHAVPKPKLNEPYYFIPHHCVLKPESTSTKLRVVFDASCRTSTQKSINDIQMVGPTLQNELVILLLRFRLHRFALTADIVKMYRQILVNEEHRRFQYILWRSSARQEIQTFQLNTVTYGMAAAPYLAVRSLHYLADQHASQFVVGSNVVKTSFYVDDMLCGADSLTELLRIKHEVAELLKLGGFELAKWHSNHQRFRGELSVKDLNLDTSVTSALGLKWDQVQDNFLFSFLLKQPTNGRVTKRSILSTASSLFDPLGLLAPVIVTAKILLQELWLLKLDWDESVPQNVQSAWLAFVNNLSDLTSIKIPRYCLSTNKESLQIHGFCDSSIRAYGCGIYTRIIDNAGIVHVHLLTAKSRVAPTKRQSLPKLELCGALLLARLFSKIKPIFNNHNFDTFLWTDSQIVLHWLQLHSATLSAFVGNRVSEIQELTSDAQWRYVPTKQNPADIVSRGSHAVELASSIWFSGPAFLYEGANKWPKQLNHDLDMEIVNSEKRKSVFKVIIDNNYILEILNRCSSHTRQVRLIAWMLRFYIRLKGTEAKTLTGTLAPDELHRALLCIVWNVQQQYFADDIRLLQRGLTTNGTLRSLNPFLETSLGFELLKVGGRLELADISESQKHPLLLPSKCEFVTRYVRYLHIKNYHAGPKALVALIRLKFWIINARDIARRIVRSCVHCTRYKPKLLQHMMGNLPVERLTPSRPFARCGIDFCGPIHVYLRIRGKVPYKAYVAIFVCFATKAVHIECANIAKDAMVLIHEDNVPPQRWQMGRVIDVIPGKDARVRVFTIRTPKGIICHPIQKIALLPI